jgi:hypothetical protein
MATAPTAGKIYFIESDGVTNDDWITDHAGDPDLLDLDQYTEGTDYIQMKIPQGFTRTGNTGIIVTPMVGGKSFDLRPETRLYKILNVSVEGSLADANLIDGFAMSERHTSGASATFEAYYLVVYFGANSHLEFTDASGNKKSYCAGRIINVSTTWNESANLNFNIRINFASVW